MADDEPLRDALRRIAASGGYKSQEELQQIAEQALAQNEPDQPPIERDGDATLLHLTIEKLVSTKDDHVVVRASKGEYAAAFKNPMVPHMSIGDTLHVRITVEQTDADT